MHRIQTTIFSNKNSFHISYFTKYKKRLEAKYKFKKGIQKIYYNDFQTETTTREVNGYYTTIPTADSSITIFLFKEDAYTWNAATTNGIKLHYHPTNTRTQIVLCSILKFTSWNTNIIHQRTNSIIREIYKRRLMGDNYEI